MALLNLSPPPGCANRLMRIAQVAPFYESVPPVLYGGTERVVSWLTEELVRLVDDHAAVRGAVSRLIQDVPGFEVCGEEENGRIGIEKAKQLKPDAIVLDLSMPVMNGLEAARILRTLMPAIPILMHTAFTNPALASEALAAGVSKVASKPSPPEALIGDLQALIKDAA